MTTYALDTNIISYMLKNNAEIINTYRKANDEGYTFVIPAVVYYEIRRGLIAANATIQMKVFTNLCSSIGLEEMDIAAWEKSAQIWATLKNRGTPLGRDDGDIFIAAHCIANNYTLITNNAKDFERIDGLNFIAWDKS